MRLPRPTHPHICGMVHKTSRFTVRRKTIGKRMAAKLKAIKAELRKRMHEPIKDTGVWLRAVVQGYFNYHAVPGELCPVAVVSARCDSTLVADRPEERAAPSPSCGV